MVENASPAILCCYIVIDYYFSVSVRGTLMHPAPFHHTRFFQVVIKYVPYVGDSKRALDEYTSEIFLGGRNTISMHNTCEDSLLASPLIYDLVIMAELCDRIQVRP